MVLLKGFGADGFRFFTNYESAKGEQLDAAGRGGARHLLARARPPGAGPGPGRAAAARPTPTPTSRPGRATRQLGAWASPQSRPLADRAELDARLREVEERFGERRDPAACPLGRLPAAPRARSSSGRGRSAACTTASSTRVRAAAGGSSGWGREWTASARRSARERRSTTRTRERDEVLAFYDETLGLRRVAGWDDGTAYRLGAGVLLLFDRDLLAERDGPVADHGADGRGPRLLLAEPGATTSVRERLAAADVEITHDHEWPGGRRSFYFKDPAGNLLEVADSRPLAGLAAGALGGAGLRELEQVVEPVEADLGLSAPFLPVARTRTPWPSACSSASSACCSASTRSASGAAFSFGRPPPPGAALGLAHRPAVAGGVARQGAALVGRLGDQDRAAVALAELAGLEQLERLVGQVEDPDQVRERGAAAAEALAELLLRSARGPRPGSAQARASSTGLSCSRATFSISAVCRRWASSSSRSSTGTVSSPASRGGTPAALAGDDLVAAVGERAHDQRLDHARPRAASRRARRSTRRRSAGAAGRVRQDELDRDVAQERLGELARLRQDRGQAPPHPALFGVLTVEPPSASGSTRRRGRGRPARARRARVRAPGRRAIRASRGVLGDRQLRSSGASATRTLRGITVSNTSSGKWALNSASTSCARRVLSSCMVITTPVRTSAGFSSCGSRSSVSRNWTRPSSARYSAWTGTRTRSAAASAFTVTGPSDGGQSSRVSAKRSRTGPRPVAKPRLHPLEPRQLDRGAREVAAGRDDPEVVGPGRPRRLGDRARRRRGSRRRRASASRSSPSATVALACWSRSTSSTWLPCAATHEATLTAVVVFPTPPFWLAIA